MSSTSDAPFDGSVGSVGLPDTSKMQLALPTVGRGASGGFGSPKYRSSTTRACAASSGALAALVDADGHRLLFDTGNYPNTVLKNAEERNRFFNCPSIRRFIKEQKRLDDFIYGLTKTSAPELLKLDYLQTQNGRPSKTKVLAYLYQHAENPLFQCRFRWREGSIAFWDNRATWHYAANDYHGERRLMHRITVAGCELEAAIQ